jgi:hypothetical protein
MRFVAFCTCVRVEDFNSPNRGGDPDPGVFLALSESLSPGSDPA